MKGRKNKISRQGAIYRVALAGIASALALLLVWLSVLARYGTLGFFAAAGIVLLIPMSKKYYLSAVFAYVVSAGLCVLVGDLASVMGYILYFGPVSLLIGIFANKKIKWWIAVPIIIAYSVSMLALLYFVFKSVIVSYDALSDVKFWVVALVGTPVLMAICGVEYLAYVRIVPLVARVIRDGENEENKQSNAVDLNDDENPFEEFDTFIKPVETKNEQDENKDDQSSDGGEA